MKLRVDCFDLEDSGEFFACPASYKIWIASLVMTLILI